MRDKAVMPVVVMTWRWKNKCGVARAECEACLALNNMLFHLSVHVYPGLGTGGVVYPDRQRESDYT